MIKSSSDLSNDFVNLLGDNSTSDAALEFLENLNDSVGVVPDTSEKDNKISELEASIESLNNQLTETENSWREKYKARFCQPVANEVIETDNTPDEEEITIEDLFM